MDWSNITVGIHWMRSRRRRWKPTPQLDLGYEERHKHCNVLLYWWAGEGQRYLASGMVPVGSGVCHWARPGWEYKCKQSPEKTLGVTAIHFDLLDSQGEVILPKNAELPPEQLCVLNPALTEVIIEHLGDIVMDLRSGAYVPKGTLESGRLMFQSLLMKLEHDTPVESSEDKTSSRLQEFNQVRSFIHDQLAQLPPVSNLAERFGYSRSHFSRLFKEYVGVNPESYIINARITLAAELLTQSTLPITEIAAQAGYPDLYRFSRQFKKVTRLSPSQYRKTKKD